MDQTIAGLTQYANAGALVLVLWLLISGRFRTEQEVKAVQETANREGKRADTAEAQNDAMAARLGALTTAVKDLVARIDAGRKSNA